MTERFEEIWEHQNQFNKKIQEARPQSFKEWSNFYHLALLREVTEVLDTVDWKVHRRPVKDVLTSNTKEELVDVFKYWMSLCQLYGFTADDILEEYYRKSAVVDQRYRQEVLPNTGQVVAVDIDGVLADYVTAYSEYVGRQLGKKYNVYQIDNYDIGRSLGLTPEMAAKLKDQYRQSGQKRFIPVIDGARELLIGIQAAGYRVVLVTSRPYERYNRIFADTMEWLTANDLPYDDIIFGENKEARLLEEYDLNEIDYMIDDVTMNANRVAAMGVECLLVSRPYNTNDRLHDGVTRIDNTVDALHHIRPNIER